MQGSLSIERMCQLARVSRAGFYRFLKEHVPREEETEVRSAIQFASNLNCSLQFANCGHGVPAHRSMCGKVAC